MVMFDTLWQGVDSVLGLNAKNLSFLQSVMRTLVVYIAGLIMVRVGEKRFLGKNTAFDVLLGIILGSVVSRAITSSSGFFTILLAGFILVLLHWLFAVITFRSDELGDLLKGNARTLIIDGEIDWEAMRRSHISKDDLLGALRSNGKLHDPSDVKEARLERDGNISVIKRDSSPRILEIPVQDGVQTVRIELR
jgi:uncharacterized membrane protein YcaP (DUF421 family)